MAEGAVIEERTFSAPPEVVWSLLTDTHRYDRAMGLPAPRYKWQEVDGTRQLVGAAAQGGVAMEWIEEPYEWVEGLFLRSRRTYLRGPASHGGLRVQVTDAEAGCHARLEAFGAAKSLLLKALNPLVRVALRRRMREYFADVERALVDVGELDPAVPAAVHARRIVQARQSAGLSGGTTESNVAELKRRAQILRELGAADDSVARLETALAQRPDEEVAQMRPFELADAWRLNRRDVLRTFLLGTEAGLVELAWQINCPVCKVAAGVVRTMEEVDRAVHCEACNISYAIEFGANVEAVFRCSPSVRAVQPTVFCAASPAFRPHILAQLRLEAGERTEEQIPLRAEAVHVRTLAGQRPADLELDGVPQKLRIEVSDDAVVLHAEGRSDTARAQQTTVELVSTATRPSFVLVERAGWSADTVSGSLIATMPEFLNLFATEAPAAGLELSIARLTFLFSDLTGSTALYETVGDAKAYAIVQEHFAAMQRAIEAHGGAVVKTMGDAVMATFDVPEAAVRAARGVLESTRAQHGSLGIGIKVGIHEGACLAVRANERLDFFGTTVNVAARLQGQARTAEIVLTGELAAEPEVAAVLQGLPHREFVANLKGISAEQALRGYAVAAVDDRQADG